MACLDIGPGKAKEVLPVTTNPNPPPYRERSESTAYDAERPTHEVMPVPLSKLALRPQRVLCPACKHTGLSAVPRSQGKMLGTVVMTSTFLVFTGLLGLFCIKPIARCFWDEAVGHATHYCAVCGLNLAYWNGATYVFARDEHLNDAPPAIVGDADSEEDIPKNRDKAIPPIPLSPPHRFAKSPLGPPPPHGARLYAAKHPLFPANPRRLNIERDPDINFLKRIRDAATGETLLSVKPPGFESHGWHYENKVFLPFERDRTSVTALYRSESGGLWVYIYPVVARTSEAPEEQSAAIPVEIVFDRFSWAMVIRWADRAGAAFGSSSSRYCISSGLRTDFGTGNKHCLTQMLYFPFLSSEGPLIWTVRKGHRKMVLLDAYDRVVAYGDLLLCVFSDDDTTTTLPSCRRRLLVAEIMVTYAALRVQMQRLEEWKTAEENERAYTAQG
ncbi:hypothetical protein DL766_000405 [Monosporascus sp. MC13-8B]|uniref:LITAF domain-containing protein n=1 Tax=Monosporascus cannonballus TaxID=155416 RepID=A0ABY0GY94_9PEZI|nr:hypothetical protein DL762_007803 [Monosporascus cannonballus]RYO99022.1 hypothetical protein DL763_001827 [Monosporascus cannonballus]RYP39380.1 hypothetical protein DL766_000405 [Monosporascus sp. MC13-8B]